MEEKKVREEIDTGSKQTNEDNICDVCGKSLFNDEYHESSALNIDVCRHPEADRVVEVFGKPSFNICFVCFLRALGVKELKKGEEK